MKIPSRAVALQMLEEAKERNAGDRIQHSLYAAQAAEAIAEHHPALNAECAYVLGCLHDIGRPEGAYRGIKIKSVSQPALGVEFSYPGFPATKRRWVGSSKHSFRMENHNNA